jgi:SAM-dependent methyltransferase
VGAVARPFIYRELAGWFHLLTAPEDYAVEAALYRELILAAVPGAKRVLELGSGGGNNASHLKTWFSLTLTDVSPEMVEVSRSINPDCEHLVGDMRTLRLGRQFDAVFVHDAITYMATADDLQAAIETAFVHCRPGGIALFCPDNVREDFRPRTKAGGHDSDGRGLRYVEWVWDPDPEDTTYITDFAYLLRDEDGSVRAVYDRHLCGIFSREDWLRWLEQTGFTPRVHESEWGEDETNELFVASRPT